MNRDGLTRGQRRELVGIVWLSGRRGIPTCDLADQPQRAAHWTTLALHGLVTLTELRPGVLHASPTEMGRKLVADYPLPGPESRARLGQGTRS